MNIRKIAKKVAEDYISSHPNCDEETIYCIIEDAIPRWNEGNYNNPDTFFNIQIRNTLYQLGLYEPKTTQSAPNTASKPIETAEKNQISEPTDDKITNSITNEIEKMPATEFVRTETVETENTLKQTDNEIIISVNNETETPSTTESVITPIDNETETLLTSESDEIIIPVNNETETTSVFEPTNDEIADSSSIEPVETTKQEDNSTQKSTPKMSNELRNCIINDLIAGDTIQNVVLKYNLNLSTTRNNICHWQKKGLFPEGFIPASDKKRKKPKEIPISSEKTETTEKVVTEEPIDSEMNISTTNAETEIIESKTEDIAVSPEITESETKRVDSDIENTTTNDETNTIAMKSEINAITEDSAKTNEQLTFVTATQNILAFMEQQLHNSKLITVIADETDKTLHCKYMTSNNEIICINIRRYSE